MCRIYSGPGRIVQVSRDKPIIGYRHFQVDRASSVLLPASYHRFDNPWLPEYAPVFEADKPPSVRGDSGLYALRRRSDVIIGSVVTATVTLYGTCKVGVDRDNRPVVAAEFAEIEAVFIGPQHYNLVVGGGVNDDVIAGLLMNYPDIPILEV